MGNSDFAAILNAMPETGVYVIRASDHSLLYFNQRVREVSPEARLGVPCYEIWPPAPAAPCPVRRAAARAGPSAITRLTEEWWTLPPGGSCGRILSPPLW